MFTFTDTDTGNHPKQKLNPCKHFMKYIVCFLTRGDEVLMLQRRYSSNTLKWNGVGGKIKECETALQTCIREVREETGFQLGTASFGGILTWEYFEIDDSGLYIFHAEAPEGNPIRHNGEGRLKWLSRQRVFSSARVVSNIHIFGPKVLDGSPPREYFFRYENGRIAAHEVRPLPDWVDINTPIKIPVPASDQSYPTG